MMSQTAHRIRSTSWLLKPCIRRLSHDESRESAYSMLKRIRWKLVFLVALGAIGLFIVYVFLVLPWQIVGQLGEQWAEPRFRYGKHAPPQWTPDGTRIVFSHRGHIYVVGSSGTSLRRIHGSGDNVWVNDDDIVYDSPDISPDGSKIAYVKKHQDWFWENRYWEIATSALDGSGERILTDLDGEVSSPSWSPDGSRIAFVSRRMVHTMSQDGSDMRPIADLSDQTIPTNDTHGVYDGLTLAWSPDGRRIAFVGGSFDENLWYLGDVDALRVAMYTTEVGSSAQRKIAEVAGMPAWSPDGARMAFAKLALNRERKLPYMKWLFTSVANDSDPHGIVQLPGELRWDRIITWSPDGSEILVGPFVASADGYVLRVLPLPAPTISEYNKIMPDHFSQTSWSPDSSRIAIQTTADGSNGPPYRYELYTVARDGSDSRVLVTNDRHGNLSHGFGLPLTDGEPARVIYADGQGH